MESINLQNEPPKGLEIIGSYGILLSATNKDLIRVRGVYAQTHKIEAVKGTKVSLKQLKDWQSVVWGDGDTFHFRLTELK